MKILLTGYQGFIGQHMLRALSQHDVATFEWGDTLPDIKLFDWVIHIGAISSTTERDVDKVMEQNYDFSVDLYRQCRHWEVNFQFASSASVYGLSNNFTEDGPVDPRTPYAWSKYMVERFIKKYPPVNSVAQCFRYFNVYGPEGEEHKGDQASPYYKFTQQAKGYGRIKIFDDSQHYQRDFIHVNEIVDYHLKFLDIPVSGVYNLGTGSTKSFFDVAMEVGKHYPSIIEHIPMPVELLQSYQKYTCADLTKLNKIIAG
jgi:ADP-L-glycero-D-manno-heptose 6-epimerase